MIRIVQNLVFQADGRAHAGGFAGHLVNGRNAGLHKNLDAAVAAGREHEIRVKLKIGIALAGDDVAAGLRLGVAAGNYL